MDVANAQPRRRRRSSISQHIHRFLHQGSKRNSDTVEGFQKADNGAEPHQHTELDKSMDKTAVDDSLLETHDSVNSAGSKSYSPNSLSTSLTPANKTDSSQSSLRVPIKELGPDPEKAKDTPFRFDFETAERSEICVSPTWNNHSTVKKEKRVTKRLEAERRELEKRLRLLEEAESKRDLSSFKREPRRLTKKQPIDSSSRDSSVGADRPRSSSATVSSFFSGVRRASRSRSRSMNKSDLASRRQSTDLSRDPPKTNDFKTQPLPLAIPERFGTAISKELADRNNTLLSPYTSSTPSPRSLHITAKSADLRGSLRTTQRTGESKTEAQNDIEAVSSRDVDNTSNYQLETEDQIGKAVTTAETLDEPLDLNRTSFAANLYKGLDTVQSRAGPSGTSATTTHHPPLSQNRPTQNESKSTNARPPKYHITPKPQTSIYSSKYSAISQNVSRPMNAKTPSTITTQGGSLNDSSTRDDIGGSHQNQQKKFKPSPLATSPTTNDSIDEPLRTKKADLPDKNKTRQTASWVLTSHGQSANSPKTTQRMEERSKEENKERSFGSSLANESPRPTNELLLKHQAKRQPLPSFDPEKYQALQSPQGLENLRHDTLSASRQKGSQKPQLRQHKTSNEPTETTSPAGARINESRCNPSARYQNASLERISRREAFDGQIGAPSGSSSRSSSQSAQSDDYDTADEAVPSDRLGSNLPAASPREPDKKPSPVNTSGSPNLKVPRRPEPQSKKPIENVSSPRQSQMVGKVFVICCRCKYWHDMPSGVYAKLAGPDLTSDQTRSARESDKNSRQEFPDEQKNPNSRARSRSRSRFSFPLTQSIKRRSMPLPQTTPVGPDSALQCRWCGHNMKRLCCQGWTTIVHMRERHH